MPSCPTHPISNVIQWNVVNLVGNSRASWFINLERRACALLHWSSMWGWYCKREEKACHAWHTFIHYAARIWGRRRVLACAHTCMSSCMWRFEMRRFIDWWMPFDRWINACRKRDVARLVIRINENAAKCSEVYFDSRNFYGVVHLATPRCP